MTRMNLWKTTIVIWTEYDPQQSELADLCRDAVEGEAYCSKSNSVLLPEPEGDPDWDGTEFFNVDNDNPPDGWEECGGCDCWHPADFGGDCRDDANRWPFATKGGKP